MDLLYSYIAKILIITFLLFHLVTKLRNDIDSFILVTINQIFFKIIMLITINRVFKRKV